MSTTEHDLDALRKRVNDDDRSADEFADELAHDGRDEALVASIEQYAGAPVTLELPDGDERDAERPEVADDAVVDDPTDDSDAHPAHTLFEDDDFADDEFVDDDETYDVPSIVARDVADADDDAAARETVEQPAVSDDILEELRRADIDGPVVDLAPQDDTTSARRRPKRSVDYDPAPVPIPLQVPRILGRKPRVRKVTRVVRHVDPWSVFKIAIIAHLVLYVIVLTAGVLLWNVAYATGTVENVERFFESFGWQSFEFNGGEIYHSAWTAGLFLVLGLTGLAVLAATLFNLITDLVGGVRFTVLEEEVVESRTSPMRRFVVRRPEPEIPAVTEDASGALIRETVVDDTGGIAR